MISFFAVLIIVTYNTYIQSNRNTKIHHHKYHNSYTTNNLMEEI